jgi:hypothetical protein
MMFMQLLLSSANAAPPRRRGSEAVDRGRPRADCVVLMEELGYVGLRRPNTSSRGLVFLPRFTKTHP